MPVSDGGFGLKFRVTVPGPGRRPRRPDGPSESLSHGRTLDAALARLGDSPALAGHWLALQARSAVGASEVTVTQPELLVTRNTSQMKMTRMPA